ncbi:hypothetical protein [Staphylococcus phage vB_Sau_P68]|nr:hypothetical protein [Staphylococcus phage vB_Sau_P68]
MKSIREEMKDRIDKLTIEELNEIYESVELLQDNDYWNKELDETEEEIALIKEKYKDRGLKGLEIVKEEQAISFAQDSINNLYD